PPQVEHGVVGLGGDPEAPRVEGTCHPAREEVGDERPGRSSLLGAAGTLEEGEHATECRLAPDLPGGSALAVTFHPGNVPIGQHELEAFGVEDTLLVQQLHVDGVLPANRVQFLAGRAPALDEATGMPPSQDAYPTAPGPRFGGLPDSLQSRLERGDVVPAGDVGPREPRSENVHVGIDEPGNRPPALQVDLAPSPPQRRLGLVPWSGGDDASGGDADCFDRSATGPDRTAGDEQIRFHCTSWRRGAILSVTRSDWIGLR